MYEFLNHAKYFYISDKSVIYISVIEQIYRHKLHRGHFYFSSSVDSRILKSNPHGKERGGEGYKIWPYRRKQVHSELKGMWSIDNIKTFVKMA